MANPWENRRPHDAIYPIGQPPTTLEQEEEELAMLAQGEPDITCTGDPAEEPDGCAFCGEPADAEMGEWWDEATNASKVGHAQCGIDSGLPMA